mmetsp:Transcript_40650/g.118552  ORF Transcript_40650/g.118552 Transcript_40650/m.118552 type:complete len:232 (+) Transcript_40650:61-756(+)
MAIDRIVRAHRARRAADCERGLVLRQVRLEEVACRDRVVVVASVGLGRVRGEVLEVREHLGVAGGVALLHATDHLDRVAPAQQRVLSRQLAAAPEPRVSRDVDVRAESGQRDERLGLVASRAVPSEVVERAHLAAEDGTLGAPEGAVERRAEAHRPRHGRRALVAGVARAVDGRVCLGEPHPLAAREGTHRGARSGWQQARSDTWRRRTEHRADRPRSCGRYTCCRAYGWA